MIWVCSDCLQEGCGGRCVERPRSSELTPAEWALLGLTPPEPPSLLGGWAPVDISDLPMSEILLVEGQAPLGSLVEKRDALRRERRLPPMPPTDPRPAPAVVVEPERPRPDIIKVHNFIMNRDNDKESKLRVLDEAIAIASGDDLRWLTNERGALVLRERRGERPVKQVYGDDVVCPAPVAVVEEEEEREYLRRWNEERELFFNMMGTKTPRGKTKTKVPRGKTKAKPPRGH